MGWDMVDTGMQVVFSSRIPHIVQTLMRENVAEFLAPFGLAIDDIDHWILHPGGAKVITLLGRVARVSVETVGIVAAMKAAPH